ncbi:hypothetical protein J2805_003923 [Arthrobacter oryzae]|nr:hypothetical protein [Arthrobacter oryzae]
MQVQPVRRKSQLVEIAPEAPQEGGFDDESAAFAGEEVEGVKRSSAVGEPILEHAGGPVEDRQDAAGFGR